MMNPKEQKFSHRSGADGVPSTAEVADFASPSMFYAPFAFWFWNHPNDIRNPELFTSMVQGMMEQGLNPGYFQARYYREGEPFWQSEDWFRCVEASVEATEAEEGFIGYTFGDPSFPDKYILPEHPELQAQSLQWSLQEVEAGAKVMLPEALFHVAGCRDASGQMLSGALQVIEGNEWTVPSDSKGFIYSFTTYCDCHRGDGKPINFLNRGITEPWLRVENDAYEKRISRHFGKSMPGIFFDLEGSFGYKLVWSEDLAELFLSQIGADIRKCLPLLLEEDVEGLWAKARSDWFEVVGKLFAENLFEPLDRWCRERGMFMTCHFWEESLFKQAVQTGDYFNAQRSYSMPGTDALFETVHDPRYFKETLSVSEFEGRPFMCEVLGVAGWHQTPADIKAAGNSCIAQGLTHVVLHGINSNDQLENVTFPPDFYQWNPYWRYFRQWTDFIRRSCAINDRGRLDAEVLILCPIESVWALTGDAYFDPTKPHHRHIEFADSVEFSHSAEVVAIEQSYTEIMKELYAARIDSLVADRHYFEQMELSDGKLMLGEFAFKAVMLPQMFMLSSKVADTLAKFANEGGQIYAYGRLPEASSEHGLNDPNLTASIQSIRSSENFQQVSGDLGSHIAKDGSGLVPCASFLSGEFPLLATRRMINGKKYSWLANNTDHPQDCELILPDVFGQLSLWHPEDATMRVVHSEEAVGEGSRIKLSFAPKEGYWIVSDPSQPPHRTQSDGDAPTASVSLHGPWKVSVDPTDQPKIANRALKAPDWLRAGKESRKLESWLNWELSEFTGYVDYQYEIELQALSGHERLCLGAVKHTAEVWVNGGHVGSRIWSPYQFDIGKYLKPGKNRIDIKVGNLILNAIHQNKAYNWKWYDAPTDEQLDGGLFGPVSIESISAKSAGE